MYHEEIEGAIGGFERYRLNCAGVSPMQPYQSHSFEMYINVPPDAPLGPTTLSWVLESGWPLVAHLTERAVVVS